MKIAARAAVLGILAASACRASAPIHVQAAEHNDQGTRYLEQGELDKAQRRFELALEFNPDYPEPYNNLCLVAVKRGQFPKAKELCIKALRLNNDFALAHNNLGYVYLHGDQNPAKAADQFRAALRLTPGYVEARYNLCLALLQLKDKVEARVCFEKIVESNEAIADAHFGLCYLDLEEGQHARAITECTRAIELNPKFADAYGNLGRAQQAAGRHCDAKQTYQDCLGVDENHAECRNNLATAVSRCALAPAP